MYTTEEIKEAFDNGRNYMLSLKPGDVFTGAIHKKNELYGKERTTLGELFMVGVWDVADNMEIYIDISNGTNIISKIERN